MDAEPTPARQAPSGKLEKGKASKKTGTIVTFWPDPEIFVEEHRVHAPRRSLERLRELAFLNKGLEIQLHRRARGAGHKEVVQVHRRPRRLREAPRTRQGADLHAVIPIEDKAEDARGRGRAAVEHRATTESFTRSPTHQHARGRHARGGPQEVPHQRAEPLRPRKGLLKEKEDNLIGEDVREGLIAIISVKLRNPQFEGQTKTKLGNAEMRSFVETTMNEQLAEWLEEHPAEAQADRARRRCRPRKARMAAARRATSRGASRSSSRVAAGQARRLLS